MINPHITTYLRLFFTTLIFVSIPFRLQAQEESTFTNLGLFGGQVNKIAIDPNNSKKMFVGTYNGDGLFLTTDGGETWKPVVTGGDPSDENVFYNQVVFSVKIAPSNSQIVWAAHNHWLEKSVDGGKTWTHIRNDTLQGLCTHCKGVSDQYRFNQTISIHPTNPNIVYVGAGGVAATYTSGAVFKTVDGGEKWTKLNGGTDFDFPISGMDIDPQNPTTLWVVTSSAGKGGWGGSLYRSPDGGTTFEKIHSLTPSSAFDVVRVKPDNSNAIFTGSGFGLIKFSFNAGNQKWDRNFPLPTSRLVQDIQFFPGNPNALLIDWIFPKPWGGDGIGKIASSTDGGVTWMSHAIGGGGDDILNLQTLAVDPADHTTFYAGDSTQGVIKISDQGTTWIQKNNGINAVIVYDVKTDPKDSSHILAGTISGLYEKKGEAAWVTLLKTSVRSVQFHPKDSSKIFTGLESNLFRTSDGGITWSSTSIPGEDGAYNNFVSQIAVDGTNPETLFFTLNGWGSYGEVYKSVDGGVSFNPVLSGENQNQPPEKYPFNTVAIDPHNSSHIFAGGGSFFSPKVNGDLWESKDGGTTWSRTSLTNELINDLLFHKSKPGIIFAAVDNNIVRSVDGGTTWSLVFEPFDVFGGVVTSLGSDRKNDDIIYASTLSKGIYISPDQGNNWANLGAPKYDVFSIATGSLYAGTEGGLQQLTGTGLLFGDVSNSENQTFLSGATVLSDLGIESNTIEGKYFMVTPAGIFDATSSAKGFDSSTVSEILVEGGEASQQDFQMVPAADVRLPITPQVGQLASPEMIFPKDNGRLTQTSIEFQWRGTNYEGAVTYQLYLGKSRNLESVTPVEIQRNYEKAFAVAGVFSSLFIFGLMGMGEKVTTKQRFLFIVLFFGSVLLFEACGLLSNKDSDGNDGDQTKSSNEMVSKTIDGLEGNATYYWKIVVKDSKGYRGETPVRSFTITTLAAPRPQGLQKVLIPKRDPKERRPPK